VEGGAQRRKRHLKRDAHQPEGFLVEPMVVQIGPKWYGGLCGDPRGRSPTPASRYFAESLRP
jgi:hypothetical protein